MATKYEKYEYSEIIKRIPEYLDALKNDFGRNKEYAETFSFLFLNGYPLCQLLFENKVITNFGPSPLSKPIPFNPKEVYPLLRVDQINLPLKKVKPDPNDLNKFLSSQEYETFEQARKGLSTTFYFLIDKKKFKKKMDAYLLSHLPDYRKTGQSGIYEKIISAEYSLFFDTNTEQKKIENIESYKPPIFSLKSKFSGVTTFFNGMDSHSLLFIGGGTFDYFYSHYTSYFIDHDGYYCAKYSTEEPIIFHNKTKNVFEIKNSEEITKRVNKYVNICLELYLHYFRVFENWLIYTLNDIRT